jgi:hypothetical protein
MTPAAIIKQAQADGVMLALSSSGSIKAVGNGEAVNRWLPVIREHKAELLAELRAANDGAYEALPDPAAEARRQKVLAMLAANPSARYAVVTDTGADPVILALAIRGQATCELLIPRDKYDGFLLLDLLNRYGGTIH